MLIIGCVMIAAVISLLVGAAQDFIKYRDGVSGVLMLIFAAFFALIAAHYLLEYADMV